MSYLVGCILDVDPNTYLLPAQNDDTSSIHSTNSCWPSRPLALEQALGFVMTKWWSCSFLGRHSTFVLGWASIPFWGCRLAGPAGLTE